MARAYSFLCSNFDCPIIGIRVLSISNYSFETADGILQAGGTATVALGAFIPVIGFIVFSAAAWGSNLLTYGYVAKRSRPFVVIILARLWRASVFVTPAIVFAIALLFPISAFAMGFGTYFYLKRSRREGETASKLIAWLTSRERQKKLGMYYIAGYVMFLLITTANNSVPWLPAEKILIYNTQPFAGYIIGETDTDVTILTSSTRQIVHVAPDTLVSRTVCEVPGVDYSGLYVDTLPMLIGVQRDSHYPMCPTINLTSGQIASESSK